MTEQTMEQAVLRLVVLMKMRRMRRFRRRLWTLTRRNR